MKAIKNPVETRKIESFKSTSFKNKIPPGTGETKKERQVRNPPVAEG